MKRIAILATVVLAVIAAWTGGWYYVANEVRTGVAALAAGDGSETPKVECGTLGITGYPFRFDLTCTDATVVSGDLTGTLAELRATVLVYQPSHVQIFAKAPLGLADAFTGAKSRINWQSFDMSIRLTNWRIARASLVSENLSWTDTLATEALIANAGHLEVHLLDIPERYDPAAHTAALAAYAKITALTSPGLDIAAGDSTLEAEITGMPDHVQNFAAPEPLRAWQARSGELKVVGFSGEDAASFFDLSGTLRLDSIGRVDGQLNLSSRGLVERIEQTVPENLRGLILGTKSEDGSYSQVVTLTSGVILSGLMPAGLIPPLW